MRPGRPGPPTVPRSRPANRPAAGVSAARGRGTGGRRRLAGVIALVAVVAVVVAGACSGGSSGSDRRSAAGRGASTTSSAGGTATSTAHADASASGAGAAAASTTTTVPVSIPAPGTAPTPPLPGEPVAASDAAGLAGQISTAAAAISDPATPQADLARQAQIQQIAYRALVNHPDLAEPTFALLAEPLRASARANVAAGAKLRALLPAPKTALPAWRIVEPAPAGELLADYRAGEAETGVPWQYLAAVHLVETRMGRIRGTSDAGAQGPMQFLPSTWAAYGQGGDVNSNHDAILTAARYLHRNGAPADLHRALWNYNHDDRYADAVTLYAEQMRADPRAYAAYYWWQVYYVTVNGDVWLPVGYGT